MTTTTTRNLEHDACLAISKRFRLSLEDLWSKAISETVFLVEETTNGTAWRVEFTAKAIAITEI